MVTILAQNARDVSLIPALGKMFPIFITPTTLVAVTMILYKLNLPCVYVREVTACMYVIVSVKRLTIPGGECNRLH